jgi:hypothetical protein
MIRLPTHLLLQLLQKVLGEGSISADPIGRLNWNLPLADSAQYARFFFLLHLSYKTPWDIFPDSSIKDPESIDKIPKGANNSSLSGTKVHPTCQKIGAPRMLHPGHRF